MTDIQFYYLASPLEQVLPKLLEKSLAGGFKVLVKFTTEEEAERMGAHLWTYNPDSFLPHGTAQDGYGDQQPIYLTGRDENPNAASLIIVTDGSQIEAKPDLKRVFDIVGTGDAAALGAAESRLARYRAGGLNVSCVRQTATGAWEKN